MKESFYHISCFLKAAIDAKNLSSGELDLPVFLTTNFIVILFR